MTVETFFAKKSAIIPRAKYLELKQYYSAKETTVHLFVEDEDDFEFYRTVVNHIYYNYKVLHYPMKGKQNVKDVYELINWSIFQRGKVLFFVDKDYDDILPTKTTTAINFFYTKHYSIENYIVTEEVFNIILDRFYVNKVEENLKHKLLEIYRKSYHHFVIKMRTLTWFILIDREKSRKAVLDNLKLGQFIHFDKMEYIEKKLIPKLRFERIMRSSRNSSEKYYIRDISVKEMLSDKCGADSSLFTFQNIMEKRNLICDISNHKSFIRGKYDLWFLLELLKTVDKRIEFIYEKDKIPVTQENPMPRKKVEISNLNVFDFVCSKMDYPDDVKSFLLTNFNSLNGNN